MALFLHKVFKNFLPLPRSHPVPFCPLFQISGSANACVLSCFRWVGTKL